ncbi:polymorphic toxin type 15 domain-containing protein [Microbacterium sp. bgisy203]|uniref:polymorphic toxin type 15 domain-containing protein n=1 Tax=Microbacterium sp. bgisy203 TaxID=3413799 RepID=UPI003D70E010
MSALKPIIRELREAALKAGIHAKDKLPRLADNLDGHFDTVIRRVRDRDQYDPSVDVNLKQFKRNPKHNSDEYKRQYDEQMDTLQNTPVSEWLKNRIEFLEHGRTAGSLREQAVQRDIALDNKYAELREGGMSASDARQAARTWLQSQAATHRLDGIAGGNQTDISGVGDTRINSSLGSQWRSRVGDIDRAVIDFINANPGADFSKVYLNVAFR